MICPSHLRIAELRPDPYAPLYLFRPPARRLPLTRLPVPNSSVRALELSVLAPRYLLLAAVCVHIGPMDPFWLLVILSVI